MFGNKVQYSWKLEEGDESCDQGRLVPRELTGNGPERRADMRPGRHHEMKRHN